ncbi:MAG: antibiotic biosynthesis monooxygenase [Leptolyngbya sp. SIO1E4]|nr:antibiotic biosynthesis monooxygenase [Leptolyngbya sp. SIO1E4]
MILEVAILDIIPGREKDYEDAFANASSIIASMPGYRSHTLKKCIEKQNRYLLLVEWDTLADHTEGFRQSDEYQTWKALLHPFYDPFPVVEHYESL